MVKALDHVSHPCTPSAKYDHSSRDEHGETLLKLIWDGVLRTPHHTQIGWTPLHAATKYCPAEKAMAVVELLLAAGAAVDTRNSVSFKFLSSRIAEARGQQW